MAVFLLLFWFALVHDFLNMRHGRRLSVVISTLVLVVIAGARYKVGGDTFSYMHSFQFIPPLSGIGTYDPGSITRQPLWILLNSLAKTINPSFYALQFLQASIVNASICVFFYRTTRYAFTAILIYAICLYPYFNFEIMREALAVSVFLWAYPFYRDKRWIRFYGLAVVAFLFHASAIILFLLPLFSRRIFRFYYAPIVFFAGVALQPVVASVIEFLAPKYWLFAYAALYVTAVPTVYGLIAIFVTNVIFPIALLMFHRNHTAHDIAMSRLVTAGIFVGATGSMFYLSRRFVPFFAPFYLVFAANTLHRLWRARGDYGVRFLSTGLVAILVVGLYIWPYFRHAPGGDSALSKYNRWYPYSSIINETEYPWRYSMYLESLS